MPQELPDDFHAEITRLSAEGNEEVNDGNFARGIEHFEHALSLLPQPTDNWTAATWLLTAIGETQFFAGEYENARISLNRAMLCPDALDNPLIWLRRGQVYFELGDVPLADGCLASAYMLGGKEIFDRQDPKYMDYISNKLKEPVND